MEIKERHQVDVDDICLFPNHDKLWKSIGKMLVNQGRNTTEHHEEVHPETMLKIYQLLALLVKVVKARGTAEYKDLLAQLPAELHGSYQNTFQWGAMFILIMFEVRQSEHCGLGVFATQPIPPGTLIIREKPFLGRDFLIILILA